MEKKLRYVWWGILILLVGAAVWKLFLPHGTKAYIEKTSSGREIVVYVTGAVEEKGLVTLPADARLADALKQVKPLPQADLDNLNLAEKLKDGQKITIPASPEPSAAAAQSSAAGTQQTPAASSPAGTNKININTADAAELDRLPGIGPALAERIIQYRKEHGPFSMPEELKEVPGIGDKTYEKMAAQVTVGS